MTPSVGNSKGFPDIDAIEVDVELEESPTREERTQELADLLGREQPVDCLCRASREEWGRYSTQLAMGSFGRVQELFHSTYSFTFGSDTEFLRLAQEKENRKRVLRLLSAEAHGRVASLVFPEEGLFPQYMDIGKSQLKPIQETLGQCLRRRCGIYITKEKAKALLKEAGNPRAVLELALSDEPADNTILAAKEVFAELKPKLYSKKTPFEGFSLASQKALLKLWAGCFHEEDSTSLPDLQSLSSEEKEITKRISPDEACLLMLNLVWKIVTKTRVEDDRAIAQWLVEQEVVKRISQLTQSVAGADEIQPLLAACFVLSQDSDLVSIVAALSGKWDALSSESQWFALTLEGVRNLTLPKRLDTID